MQGVETPYYWKAGRGLWKLKVGLCSLANSDIALPIQEDIGFWSEVASSICEIDEESLDRHLMKDLVLPEEKIDEGGMKIFAVSLT